jgi:microcystin-dependent protein
MATLFRTGNGTSTDTIIVALELVNNDWFKRNLIGALELMCNSDNWTQNGDADVDFARDKANEMVEGILIDVMIPVLPIGLIQMWPASVAPTKWLLCRGQSLLRASYADLFAILGTVYGAVDSTHFNLPDFRQRSPYGVGTTGLVLGDYAGAATGTLSVNQLPAHHHTQHIGNNVTMKAFVAGGSGTLTPSGAATSSSADMVTGDTGIGDPYSTLHPIIMTNYIIYAGV